MIILNIENKNVRWRIFEKEEIIKVYNCEKMININPFEDDKINNILLKDVAVVIFRLNTEETTKDELNWSIKISNKFKNIPIINNPNNWKYCHCKIEAFKKWKENDIPIPDYFEFTDENDFYDNLKKSKINLPIIIKANNLCGGNGSFLIKKKAELDVKLTKLINFTNNNRNEFSKMLCVKFIESKTISKKFNIQYLIYATKSDIITGWTTFGNDWNVHLSSFKPTQENLNEFIMEQIKCENIIKKNKKLICNAVKSAGLDGIKLDALIDDKDNLIFLETQIGFGTGYANDRYSPPPYYVPSNKIFCKFFI